MNLLIAILFGVGMAVAVGVSNHEMIKHAHRQHRATVHTKAKVCGKKSKW